MSDCTKCGNRVVVDYVGDIRVSVCLVYLLRQEDCSHYFEGEPKPQHELQTLVDSSKVQHGMSPERKD